VRLVRNMVGDGPSAALRRGFEEAAGECILVTMADQSDDLSQISALLELVPRHADIACPSRYCTGGRHPLSGIKPWLSRAAGTLLYVCAGLPTRDPTNSFKMYSRNVLRALPPLTSLVSFSVTLEILAKAHLLGYRIAEIPTIWSDRTCGRSSFRTARSIPAYLRWFALAILGANVPGVARWAGLREPRVPGHEST
jgi:dolichol-phosphate mannosyltransferase